MIGKNLVRLYSHLNGVPKNVRWKIVPRKNVLPGKNAPWKSAPRKNCFTSFLLLLTLSYSCSFLKYL